MSRTHRKLHPRLRQGIMYPWIDPLTLKPYVWSKNQWRYERHDAAELRGDDGKCRRYRYRGPWSILKDQNEQRTRNAQDTRQRIVEQFIDAQLDWEEMFDVYDDAVEYDYLMYLQEEEEFNRELEMELEMEEHDLDDWYDPYLDDPYYDYMY